ncbi:MAG TPA: hypothetical protein QF905_08620 [Acidimicrobiales bacterium]|jgi:hypothetical protein|nr:hypothetical protein [Actinomycetota bacterium]MDP6062082.1 hypothetical protein [Acidimicrobiales bacterium]MDP6214396.1 hypothetical protein [Acidimicrobiales bacterium]MDP7209716.1 hypothetical protein [Acidimicrobiales bacterium]HJL90382.1 hypothetical protein [Acidimicrobiales bacterium]
MRLSTPSRLTGKLLRRSLLGGGRRWQLALVVVLVGRVVRRATKLGAAPVVFSRSLKPGDGVFVSHLPESENPGAVSSGTAASTRRVGDFR